MKKLTFILFFFSLFFSSFAQQLQIIYVDSAATGKNDGTSWENAFTDLQDALKPNSFFSLVYVAKGSYYPSKDDPNISFIIDDRPVFGGFGKVGSSYIQNPKQFPTILSGNIGDKLKNTDNSYHVVNCLGRHFGNSFLYGFTIEDGNADSQNIQFSERKGGGLLISNFTANSSSQISIVNCTFKNNTAESGGAIYSEYLDEMSSLLVFIDSCKFEKNSSGYNNGGAIYCKAPPVSITGANAFWITNCEFEGNTSLNSGGGIYFENINGNYSINNCRFIKNNVQAEGGAIACNQETTGSKTFYIRNCIFDGNSQTGDGTVWFSQTQPKSDTLTVNFKNCQFNNNKSFANTGGAIHSTNYANFVLNIDSCLFYKNFCRNNGGSIYLENNLYLNLKISKSQFIKNTTQTNTTGGIFVAGFTNSKWTIKNNILIENTLFQNNKDAAAFAMGANGQMNTVFNHCTFYNNGEYVIGKTTDTSYNNIDRFNTCHIYNSIFYEKYAPIYTMFYNGDWKNYTIHDYYLKNCLVSLPNLKFGNTNIDFGSNIFNKYPMFKDTLNGDFRLDSCSSAVNVGYNFITDSLKITKDLVGNNRLFGTTVDMGAYEVQAKCLTATNEIGSETDFIKVSPNPAYDLLTIEIAHLMEKTDIILCDLTGRELIKTTLADYTNIGYMDVSKLAAGMYVVQLKSKGRVLATEKVIKE